MNKTAATIHIGTATGQAQTSEASFEFPLPDLPPGLFGNIMSGLTHNLFGIGDLCDGSRSTESAPKLNPEQNFCQVPVSLLAGATREEREQQQNCAKMGAAL